MFSITLKRQLEAIKAATTLNETHHGHLQNEQLEYFQACLQSLRGQQTMMRKSEKVEENAWKAYQVAFRIALKKKKKLHIETAEDLMSPAANDVCGTLLVTDEYAKTDEYPAVRRQSLSKLSEKWTHGTYRKSLHKSFAHPLCYGEV